MKEKYLNMLLFFSYYLLFERFSSIFPFFEVPKRLLQEPGHRPPEYHPPSATRDPNVVGDGPSGGSSVQSTVPSKQQNRCTSGYFQTQTFSFLKRTVQSWSLPKIKTNHNLWLKFRGMCILKVTCTIVSICFQFTLWSVVFQTIYIQGSTD